MKRCKTCQQEKDATEYYKYSAGGLNPNCKPCARAKAREHYAEYYPKNAKEIIKRTKKYRQDNPETMKSWHASYAKNRRQTDLNFRLAHNLRKRISNYIADSKNPRTYRKPTSVIKSLGCKTEALIKYLESKWSAGMTWDNYGSGTGKWEIDHIQPLDSFNLQDINEFNKANHYSNLQPLWHEANRKKSNRLDYNVPTSALHL